MTTTVTKIGGSTLVSETTANSVVVSNATGASGRWHSIDIENGNSSQVFLRIWDDAAPTNGTTLPDWIIPVAGNAHTLITSTTGEPFENGISFTATSSQAHSGTTAPGSAVVVRVVIA